MCGIVGAIALEGPIDPAIHAAIGAMTATLSHRGPDGEGVHTDEHAALGHRRLAIIDVAGGAQPMPSADGSRWIVFNGEIYNHRALRRELEATGRVFRTRSDTEAILHAWDAWGIDCVQHLEGMFAFALWDARARELFLARDRLGKKPLFWATLGGALHFASEVRALERSPAWDGALDLEALEGYLSLGYFLAPDTIYRHVRKLEPGTWLRLRRGSIEQRRYWRIERFDDIDPASFDLDELETTIGDAVRARLESEVPLGAFLSGGIDSGLVVSFMREALSEVTTASVGFDDPAHDELGAAGLTARALGTRHHPEVVVPRIEDVIDEVIGGFDEPLADSSAVPTWYVSSIARRHVTVALSGDGGDESFAGYDFRYVPHALEERVRGLLPGGSAGRLARAAAARWPRSPALPRPLRLATILDNLGGDAADAYYGDLCFLKPAETRRLLGLAPSRDPRSSPVYERVTEPYRRCPSRSAIQRACYADLQVYLSNDVLVKVDRMSMRHGLEVRCPLLDRRVIELAFRLPERLKMPRLRAKDLLKRLARRRLPAAVVGQPKRGFTAPVGEWLRGPLAPRFRDEVLGGHAFAGGVLDAARVRRSFDEHVSGALDHSHALWAVLTLEIWARRQGSNEPQRRIATDPVATPA